jgi:hypothetical protein
MTTRPEEDPEGRSLTEGKGVGHATNHSPRT